MTYSINKTQVDHQLFGFKIKDETVGITQKQTRLVFAKDGEQIDDAQGIQNQHAGIKLATKVEKFFGKSSEVKINGNTFHVNTKSLKKFLKRTETTTSHNIDIKTIKAGQNAIKEHLAGFAERFDRARAALKSQEALEKAEARAKVTPKAGISFADAVGTLIEPVGTGDTQQTTRKPLKARAKKEAIYQAKLKEAKDSAEKEKAEAAAKAKVEHEKVIAKIADKRLEDTIASDLGKLERDPRVSTFSAKKEAKLSQAIDRQAAIGPIADTGFGLPFSGVHGHTSKVINDVRMEKAAQQRNREALERDEARLHSHARVTNTLVGEFRPALEAHFQRAAARISGPVLTEAPVVQEKIAPSAPTLWGRVANWLTS